MINETLVDNMTDTMIQVKGLDALVNELGNVNAERFINLIIKEPFDYTEWRKNNLHTENSIRELSKKAVSIV